jgi:hypothetical protein
MARIRITIALACALVLAAAAPVSAQPSSGVEHTTGEFVTLPGGAALGYDIEGTADMYRVAGARTVVHVSVTGLDARTEYPTHVHNGSCSASPPGLGHYQHVVGGPVDPVNEIWPVIRTRQNGDGYGAAHHDHVARPDARSVVIHYPADTSIRLACADLS